MSFAAQLRSVTGTETIDEREARLVQRLVDLAPDLHAYEDAVSELPAAEQRARSIQACAAAASEILTKDLVVAELDPVLANSYNAATLRYSALCNARRRFDITLFTKEKV